ncbi:hypothetical protein HCCG_01959 [Helicobacter cinaedi CCUG 18818 = ATCC BAA-847]|uniref:Uncharacterized protein n=1 Tax=Helicobacter cinaedi CCUG 18818 = ATCC BAA-847 TaxID=537971 RepID=A0ABN0BCV0_9HELI|nr:hypothetical protein HCCG_01959 [Helicobacter cinaedi CCUG 18818 = ATCC BAA-847]
MFEILLNDKQFWRQEKTFPHHHLHLRELSIIAYGYKVLTNEFCCI